MHHDELVDERPPCGGQAAPSEGLRCGTRSRCSHARPGPCRQPGSHTQTPSVQTPAMLQSAPLEQPNADSTAAGGKIAASAGTMDV